MRIHDYLFNVKPMADRTCHDVVVDVVIYTCDHDPRRERRLCIFACQYPLDMTTSSPPMARCCVKIMVMTWPRTITVSWYKWPLVLMHPSTVTWLRRLSEKRVVIFRLFSLSGSYRLILIFHTPLRWCNNHKFILIFSSTYTGCFLIIFYLATIFGYECGPSSGHYVLYSISTLYEVGTC
jgi:hypothetical protein